MFQRAQRWAPPNLALSPAEALLIHQTWPVEALWERACSSLPITVGMQAGWITTTPLPWALFLRGPQSQLCSLVQTRSSGCVHRLKSALGCPFLLICSHSTDTHTWAQLPRPPQAPGLAFHCGH